MTNSYSKLYGVKAIKDIIEVPRLKPLLCFAISNIGSISTSHHYDTNLSMVTIIQMHLVTVSLNFLHIRRR